MFAEALAEHGVVAAVPHYLASTGTVPGQSAMRAMHAELPEWRAACRDALMFTQQHPRVDAHRIGLLGFSLGGHLALSLGMAPPAEAGVKCVVDFFGPTTEPLLIGNRSLLPPVLIYHGTADRTVPILNSERLVAQLMGTGKTRGREYEYLTYPGQKPRLRRRRARTLANDHDRVHRRHAVIGTTSAPRQLPAGTPLCDMVAPLDDPAARRIGGAWRDRAR